MLSWLPYVFIRNFLDPEKGVLVEKTQQANSSKLNSSSAHSQTASVTLNNTSEENFVFSGLIKVIFFYFPNRTASKE